MAAKIQAQNAPLALPALEICQQARLSRDPRFDGRFFVGVLTTGIYCRPICPARLPKEDNVRYYACAASAQAAGFRPCMRCRPEAAQALPEWTLGSDTVMRALRMIESGYLNNHTSRQLAAHLEVGDRQLSRLFAQELGASPVALAKLCRTRLANNLLSQSKLNIAAAAYHAGYGSTSRFNEEIKQVFGKTPGQLRKQGTSETSVLEVSLPIRGHYNFAWVFEYLRQRALLGEEEVVGEPGAWCYRRLVSKPGEADQWLQVTPGSSALNVRAPLVDEPLHSLLYRVKRVFDLNADGDTLHDFLDGDAVLGDWVKQAPGLRVPGAWDGFETAVRAVLGQQVSVARGTELARKMMHRYGEGRFPRADQLLNREVAELGMPGQRGRAISQLARHVDAGQLMLHDGQDFDTVVDKLTELKGIGPWTANYVRMRVLKDPNAFPDNDWVVMKELNCTAAKARQQSLAWQPWRAYGLMYLWYAAGQRRAQAISDRQTNQYCEGVVE